MEKSKPKDMSDDMEEDVTEAEDPKWLEDFLSKLSPAEKDHLKSLLTAKESKSKKSSPMKYSEVERMME